MVEEQLIKEREFDNFILRMSRIGYVMLDGPTEDAEHPRRPRLDDDVLIAPGLVFRRQDMYIELRALDYFSNTSSDLVRRERRKALRDSATRFFAGRQGAKRYDGNSDEGC